MADKKDNRTGVEIILDFLKTLPNAPGVYRMFNKHSDVIYVGKAKDLKKRVANYTQPDKNSLRIQRMIHETLHMEFIETHTEEEALLLEANLIKKLKPTYNILLRDGKSLPYIEITGDHDYPLLKKFRGAQNKTSTYFGPFASAYSVNETITILQKAFMLRNCPDTVFATRTRPCLQYQIKRCTAPCVDYVSKEQYAEQVKEAQDFLEGKSDKVQKKLVEKMQEASEAKDYEGAALYRDRIKALSYVQQRQDINLPSQDNLDIFAVFENAGQICIQVFFFRNGQNFGNKSYFPRHEKEMLMGEVLSQFIMQFYDDKPVPPVLLVSTIPDEKELIEQALALKGAKKNSRIEIIQPVRGDRKRIMDSALHNAKQALARRLLEETTQKQILENLVEIFDLNDVPNRIEIYDNSHISGTSPIGAMVVAGPEGFMKNAYRKFNMNPNHADDDFAMMREMFERRFSRAQKEDPTRMRGEWPDLILVDGGKGQLSSADGVLKELGIDDIPIFGISKGPDRNAGREKFHAVDGTTFELDFNDPVLYFLQRLRDESHRFAIGSHRVKRSKNTFTSPLDEIDGIGAKRKKALLLYFGSAKGVEQAGLTDLQKVDGISAAFAKKIYDHFHG